MRPWAKEATNHRKLKETRRGRPLEHRQEPQPYWHPDVRLLTSRTVRQYIFIMLSLHVFADLLLQVPETNTAFIKPFLDFSS